ncbi:discoidin domain-containing protein [Actinoplanes sp. NPDC048988]|uniref:discoidin domain-containing protein n=1 Tax=Actinoplanes sp. NPDC048988 TaxID=3363901 RepID=UPI0037242C90
MADSRNVSSEKVPGNQGELALHRPVTASSTAYGPAQPSFAVDRLAQTGVQGSGWRAGDDGAQWIAVDLQGPCEIERITLTFEATPADEPFDGKYNATDGDEIQSSAATAYTIEVSSDGESWAGAYETVEGAGGVQQITLAQPVRARHVRLSVLKQHNTNPAGLNGFQVYGRELGPRPATTGWTDWAGGNTEPAPALSVAADGTVPLESGWALTMDDFADSDPRDWVPATVPGTVLASLVEQGHLPDPVAGFENLRIPEALSRHAWWYRRAFELPPGFDGSRRVWLEFDGVNHAATTWVNGVEVGTVTHPFARAAFDITEALNGRTEHTVRVKISPMPHPGTPGDKSLASWTFLHGGSMYKDSPTYLAVSGWDWMPAVRDRASGIWNHVRLRSTGDIVIGDPHIATKVPDLRTAEVTVTVPVRNAAATATTVTLTTSLGGSETVTVAAGATTDVVFATVHLRDPQLWWPNGYGEPHLHDLTVTATIDRTVSDSRQVRYGLREFSYDTFQPVVISPPAEPPLGGYGPQTVDVPRATARYVRLQAGRGATGGGVSLWTLSVLNGDTDLALGKPATASSSESSNPPGNVTDGNPRTRWASAEHADGQWIQVDLGAAATFDRVKVVWETAYAKDFVIQASPDGSAWKDVKAVDNRATELKISVNGVPVFCRGGNWGWDELLRRTQPHLLREAVAMHRDMNFTMIRNWIGSSTREEFFAACDEYGILVWNDFWEAGPFIEESATYDAIVADTIRRYRHHPSIAVWCGANEQFPPPAIDAGLRRAVAELDPEIAYVPSSNAGIVSGNGPWHWIDPATYADPDIYEAGTLGFHTEIGMPVVPHAETMRNLAGAEPAWPIGEVWGYHDWATSGNQHVGGYQQAIEERLGVASSLEEFSARAQFVNYESHRAMFEAWNSSLFDNASGLLLWMSHPAWYSTVWQTYDYDLDVNGAYYGARKSCAPRHVQADPGTWRVRAVNHTPSALTNVTVTARAYDLAGKTLGREQKQTLSVAASATTPAFTVAAPQGQPLHVVRLEMRTAKGELLSENTYWRYTKPSDMRALSTMASTTLDVRTSPSGCGLTATIANRGGVVAALVRVALRDGAGERVLPAEYSDNYFWLLPGESRKVAVTWPSRLGRPHGLKVTATAYNS